MTKLDSKILRQRCFDGCLAGAAGIEKRSIDVE
jgi:hypothetical protein